MKNALDTYLGSKGTDDVGTAAPAPYESDMMLASEDDMGGEEEAGGLMNEVQGMLAGATPEQLQQVKEPNIEEIRNLQTYLNELDRRRGTN